MLNDLHFIFNVSLTLPFRLYYSVKENDVLCSATHTYKVLKVIGSGYYGDVAQCETKETKENVAVKIFKNPDYFKLARNEVSFESTVFSCISDTPHHRLVFQVVEKCFHVFFAGECFKAHQLKTAPKLHKIH